MPAGTAGCTGPCSFDTTGSKRGDKVSLVGMTGTQRTGFQTLAGQLLHLLHLLLVLLPHLLLLLLLLLHLQLLLLQLLP